MNVTLVQQDLVWADAPQNHERFEAALLAAPGSDLYVLPEMWNTGFVMQPEKVAQSPDGPSLCWMHCMARQLDAALAGSIAVRLADGSYVNRLYFVTPDGVAAHYDKHHLFSYGGETRCYTPGRERVVAEWRGVRFLLLVCYDLRFPLWSRCRDDYDAILYVASWPTRRELAWRTLLRARAIENQCYVVGVNRVGSDPVCDYFGGSAFVNPYGEARECPDGVPATLTGTIDLPFLRHFRDKFPVLAERD